MTTGIFLDTSILVRLFDDDEPVKQAAVRSLIGDVDGPPLVISAQVLAEFVHIAGSEMAHPLSAVTIRRVLVDLLELQVVPTDVDLILGAIDLVNDYGLRMRDALILQAAATSACALLLTEVLTHGMCVSGVSIEDLDSQQL